MTEEKKCRKQREWQNSCLQEKKQIEKWKEKCTQKEGNQSFETKSDDVYKPKTEVSKEDLTLHTTRRS